MAPAVPAGETPASEAATPAAADPPARSMSEASPLLEFFKRGEVARDVRLLAAQGGFAPRADEQLSILVHLLDDPDPEIRSTADDTLTNIPPRRWPAFSPARTSRSTCASSSPTAASSPTATSSSTSTRRSSTTARRTIRISRTKTSITKHHAEAAEDDLPQRLKAAVKGSKEIRMILVRDTSKMIAAAAMSSPKMTEQTSRQSPGWGPSRKTCCG